MTARWPVELTLYKDRRSLSVAYDDGHISRISAEKLRVESPSAEVQGHGPGQKIIVTGKAQVAIRAVQPVGTYAVRLVFDDGHDSGIYTWDYLDRLGQTQN